MIVYCSFAFNKTLFLRSLPTISLISLLVLFLEMLALPFFLPAGEKNVSNNIVKEETCCAGKGSTGTCSKSSDAGNDGPECCVNCPLFYVMLTPQFIMPGTNTTTVKRNYSDHSADYFFTFYCSAWKPPDVC